LLEFFVDAKRMQRSAIVVELLALGGALLGFLLAQRLPPRGSTTLPAGEVIRKDKQH